MRSKFNAKFQEKNAVKTFFRILKSIKRYYPAIFTAVLGLVILAVIDGICYKNLIPSLVDKCFVTPDVSFMKIAPFYIMILYFTRGFATFLTSYFMGYVGRNTIRNFRYRMLKHMMLLPVSFFQTTSSGDLISKINYDAEQLANSITSAISDTLRGILIFISIFVVMFLISWRITLFTLIMAPIFCFIYKYISFKMRMHSTNVQSSMGEVTQVANEVVEGYKIIKSFNSMWHEKKRIKAVTENNKKQEMKMFFVTSFSVPFMQFIGSLVLAAFIFLTTRESINITAGEFTGLFTAMMGLLRPIKQITAVNGILQRGIAAAESIFGLLDRKKEEDFGNKRIKRAKGSIEFKNVYFAYPSEDEDFANIDLNKNKTEDSKSQKKVSVTKNKNDCKIESNCKLKNKKNVLNYTGYTGNVNDVYDITNNLENVDNKKYVLKDINYFIKPGESVALIGHSGSGKSTMISLIPRFFSPTRGSICIDGNDIKEYKLEDLRDQIALVSQDIVLFNDTISNNIAYGKKGKVSKIEVYDAAKAAFVSEFALHLPNGLDTMIGENGVKLSGGQRQRIAIARAILKNAPILILDEATSALDTESERYIQKALDQVVVNRTTLIIAHRLSTIKKVDRIFVIKNGRIVEEGSHDELMQQESKYSKLHYAQFSDF